MNCPKESDLNQADQSAMQDCEAAYQQSLQDAYVLFQRLEATLSSFMNSVDQTDTFLFSAQSRLLHMKPLWVQLMEQ